MTFPLSKTANLDDLLLIDPDHAVTVAVPDLLEGQHPIRLWEYTMAHYAIREWMSATMGFDGGPPEILDVGGAGSQFWKLLQTLTTSPVGLVDPNLPESDAQHFKGTLETAAATLTHGWTDVITCISVIEHLEMVKPLIRAAHMLLKPGGLFFLTTDCWNSEGPDTAHYHWMRKRIYNPGEMRKLAQTAREVGFQSFGKSDWSYNGHTVFDYSMASLAMVKKS